VAEEHGFRYTGLQIRLQRSRWGSCSSQGRISLNLAILFHLPDVLRYLLVHELAHTQHMNHSARFWATVERCEPRWRELDAQLRTGWRRVPEWLRPRRRLPSAP
jgi:predicted metal-dependent hydrolase